jgi:8-hydroxy-5-deazaflavin:NADPH oxidoreductase
MTTAPTAPLRIVVVGGGHVGRALGENLRRLGHEVRYALRSPDGPDATTPSIPVAGAAGEADVTVLAIPFDAVAAVIPALELPEGAILVDATNPFGRPLPDGVTSGAELVATAAGPDVRVVKAFNVLGAEHMADPPLPDGARPLLPVAGDDDDARATVMALATAMGFDAIDVGALDAAGLLEDAARYWGLLAFRGRLGRDVVLVAHHRPGADAPR